MIKSLRIMFLCLGLLPSFAQADIRPIASIGVGVDSADVSMSRTVTLIPPFQNSYVNYSTYDAEVVGGLFLGGEWSLNQNWFWQLGFGYYQNSAFIPTGVVNQFNDTAFNNLQYSFHIQSRRYLIETKLLATVRQIYHPYLVAGVGEAVNKSNGYEEVALTSDGVPMEQPFNSKTLHAFTYALGLGVDADVTSNIRLGAGYRFVNLGRAGLSTTPLQEGADTLKYNSLRANEFLLQATLMG